MAPLFLIEFLHRAVDIFEDYFSDCTEAVIKENHVLVYEASAEFSIYLYIKADPQFVQQSASCNGGILTINKDKPPPTYRDAIRPQLETSL